jgi:hypothetical protein
LVLLVMAALNILAGAGVLLHIDGTKAPKSDKKL